MDKPLYDNRHYNTPGHAHELTSSCNGRSPYFKDEVACRIFLDALRRIQVKYNFHLWAFMVMPNHVHLLIWPYTSDYDVAKILQAINGTMSRRYSRLLSRTNPDFHSTFLEKSRDRSVFRFWLPGGGFDRNLYNDTAIHNSIRYIENNPVRSKLVIEARDYRWSSAWQADGSEKWRPSINRISVPVKMDNRH